MKTEYKYKTNLGLFFSSQRRLLDRNIVCSKSSIISFLEYGNKYSDGHTGFGVHEGEIYQIQIHGQSIEQIKYLANLIVSSKGIVDGDVFFALNQVDENIEYYLNSKTLSNKIDVFEASLGWYKASLIAAKAYGNISIENAIFKYQLAHEFCNISSMDLEPEYDKDFSNPYPYDHLKFAQCIILSYAVLEELGLEIRLNGQKSSATIDGQQWNEFVLADLLQRISEKNIDSKQRITWIVRGKMQRPYKNRIINPERCEWSDGESINDFYISIPDAILELSYIRSKVCSHGIGNRASALTVCDVENAYGLVRSILLDYFKINPDLYSI